jgi:iron complex transport system permease protein
MFLFAAATSLLQYLATENQVQAIVFWGFGNLGRVGWHEVMVAAFMILVPLPFAIKLSWDLNTLALGEDSAASLGANVTRLRYTGVVIMSLMAAGSICFTGLIGFVGLVSPHITRMCLGTDHRFLIPGSALFGVTLVTLSDTLARSIIAPQILPIGIITSFLGVPFFFWLLLKSRGGNF